MSVGIGKHWTDSIPQNGFYQRFAKLDKYLSGINIPKLLCFGAEGLFRFLWVIFEVVVVFLCPILCWFKFWLLACALEGSLQTGIWHIEGSKRASPRLDRQMIVRLKYKDPGDPKTRGTICRGFSPCSWTQKSIATTVSNTSPFLTAFLPSLPTKDRAHVGAAVT